MTIGSLFFIAGGNIPTFAATAVIAGIELGTIGVILVALVAIGVLVALGLWVLWVVLFFLGSP